MRLIDADALKENAYREGGAQSIAEMVVTVSDIDDAPTVDAVLVIQCRDCKYYNGGSWCGWCDEMLRYMYPTDYCALAKRDEE